MYRPVKNPAFPALPVISTPYCCNVDAIKRTVPARILGIRVFINFDLSNFSLSKISITGIRDIVPKRNHIPLKVNAPTYSAPTLCATKAKPQIIAVKKSKIVDLIFVFIICITTNYKPRKTVA